ncbi:MAG: hypothetical protein V4736_02935 [Bdellovibrionota bacterium]
MRSVGVIAFSIMVSASAFGSVLLSNNSDFGRCALAQVSKHTSKTGGQAISILSSTLNQRNPNRALMQMAIKNEKSGEVTTLGLVIESTDPLAFSYVLVDGELTVSTFSASPNALLRTLDPVGTVAEIDIASCLK